MDSGKHQKRSETFNDRITNLPNDLKRTILARLPLEEAVRTSSLSRKWRYTWASIPNLVFTETSTMGSHELKKFIDMVLLLHQGPIWKCELYGRKLAGVPVERWILVLSRNGIEEIKILFPKYWRMPSCFFTTQSLKKVHLENCILKLPHAFCGLTLLGSLHLEYCTISDDDLEKLVSSCPLLENLYLVFMSDMVVKINSPNLKLVKIYCGSNLRHIHLITPGLIEADLSLMGLSDEKYSRGNYLIHMFGSLSKIETLHLGCSVIRHLLNRGCSLELPLKFDHLKKLTMHICVEDRNQATLAFSFLKSAPNLQNLRLVNSPLYSDAPVPIGTFWDLAIHEIVFEHLKFAAVKFFYRSVTESVLLPVKFLLCAAPFLEKMHIINYKEDFEFLKKLISLKRASKEAEILLFECDPDIEQVWTLY